MWVNFNFFCAFVKYYTLKNVIELVGEIQDKENINAFRLMRTAGKYVFNSGIIFLIVYLDILFYLN